MYFTFTVEERYFKVKYILGIMGENIYERNDFIALYDFTFTLFHFLELFSTRDRTRVSKNV